MGALFDPYRQGLPPLSPQQERLLEGHHSLLREWNEKINLVSRKSFDKVVPSQYVDCLHIADFAFPHLNEMDVGDVGSGAGFPGLIFAIRYPQIPIVLFESIGKKRAFLETAARELGLENVDVREGFQDRDVEAFVFARAVFSGSDYFTFFRERLLPGSRLVRNLGSQTSETVESGFRILASSRYPLPEDFGERVVQILERST